MNPIRALLSFCSWCASRLSPRGVERVAAWLGAVWWYVLRYRRRVILENLNRAFPDQTIDLRRGLGRRATSHLVRTLLEFLRIPHLTQEELVASVRFEGFEHFRAAKAQGRGVLFLSGHLGSFEYGVAASVPQTHPVWIVVKRFPGAVDAFVSGVRTGAGVGLIPAKRAIRKIIEALRRNETVVFVLDQNATRSVGTFVEFFGERASTFSAMANLARHTGAPVLFAQPFRDEQGQHVLRVTPPIPFEEQATEEETLRHMTQVYTRVIEAAIREHPEQWFWTHKRWRTRDAIAPQSRP